MNWIDKLERKYRHFGISNLMLYIVLITGLVYAIDYFNINSSITNYLFLQPSLVLDGQIWRLFTYIFIPPNTSPLFVAFILYFYYLVGSALENEWGTFRFNLYYLIGILGTTLGSFLTGTIGTSSYLNLSLFLAFAWIYPDFQFRIFFVLPVKVKYLAIIYLIFLGFTMIVSPFSYKIAAITALINFFIFFGKDIILYFKNRKSVYSRRKDFKKKTLAQENEPMHRCTVCGITNFDDPEMDFRYCVECNGHYGYCEEHLHNHEHIK